MVPAFKAPAEAVAVAGLLSVLVAGVPAPAFAKGYTYNSRFRCAGEWAKTAAWAPCSSGSNPGYARKVHLYVGCSILEGDYSGPRVTLSWAYSGVFDATDCRFSAEYAVVYPL